MGKRLEVFPNPKGRLSFDLALPKYYNSWMLLDKHLLKSCQLPQQLHNELPFKEASDKPDTQENLQYLRETLF
jgi:hypothetical protein